jgi:hypothetical protein
MVILCHEMFLCTQKNPSIQLYKVLDGRTIKIAVRTLNSQANNMPPELISVGWELIIVTIGSRVGKGNFTPNLSQNRT